MYPWVLLTVVKLTKKQQPTFEILLSQIEFFKTNYETQLQKSKSNNCRHFIVVIQVNGGLRIRVRDKATERRKRSKVKEKEGEESMVYIEKLSL